jgi:hypothetical protein
MHQPDEPLFVCRSFPFDGLNPHNLLRIVDLVKDMQIAHAETMHLLEVPLQLFDMPVQMGIPGKKAMASVTLSFKTSSAFR